MKARANKALAAMVICCGLATLGQGLYIPLKAELAQWLLNRSWEQALAGGHAQPPWPWADAQPVARLLWAAGEVDQIVLSNASARGMAFGPGHVSGSATPGQIGHVVLTAHRDTHFAFLGGITDGDLMQLEHTKGRFSYRVVGREIIDLERSAITLDPERDQLTLVTCWPLDSWRTGGSQRLLVHLTRIIDSETPT